MDAPTLAATVHRMFEDAFERGDYATLEAHLSPSYVDHSPIPAPGPGPAGFAARVGAMRAAFGDLAMTIHEVSADGDRVWFRWTLAGKHVGFFNGIAPTGRAVTLDGINLEVFDGDRIVEHFSQFDRASLMAQLTG